MREAVVQALDTMTNENLEMVQMNIDYAVSIAQKLAAT